MLEGVGPVLLLLTQPAQQADPLTGPQLETVQAVLGQSGGGAPGKLGLAGDLEWIEEEVELAIQGVGQQDKFIRLERPLAILDIGNALAVFQAHGLSQPVLRPAGRLAGSFDTIADESL